MLGADTGDIAVAAITGFCLLGGALAGMYGVMYSARMQARPRVVEPDHDPESARMAKEIERRIRAELEVERLREIARFYGEA